MSGVDLTGPIIPVYAVSGGSPVDLTKPAIPVYVAGSANTVSKGHVAMALVGDSILRRQYDDSLTISAIPMSCFINWADWMVGNPFVIEHNFGVSGDTASNILSRISYIPESVEAVAVLAGINDIVAFSAASTGPQITAEIALLNGYFDVAIAALTNAKKKVILFTIPPNNAFTPSTDARIQVLDGVNAHIKSLASSTVFVVDLFTAVWDSGLSTTRVYASGMSTDGTHPNHNGSQVIGVAAMSAMRSLYNVCTPNRDLYAGYQMMQMLYNNFHGTGGTKTAGTGTLADGWRSINNSGTATFTLDNTVAYTIDTTNMVGPWVNTAIGPGEFWQTFSVSSAALNDNPRLRWITQPTNATSNQIDVATAGDLFFMEIEAKVTSNVNLRDISVSLFGNFAQGTSPADQSYMAPSGGNIRVLAGSASSYSLTDAPTAASYRCVFRTPVLRMPENVNMVSTTSLLAVVDMIFAGVGSANISFARPRIWHKCQGRAG